MESLPNQPFYSITDAARLLGVSPTTLRRWENEGRIIPLRTIGGDRRYSPQDIQKVLTSFREETDQRRETEPENQTTRKPNNQLPPPLVPIRQLESYRPSRRGRPLRSLVILVAVLLLTFGFFNSLPQLTRTRLERALTTEPTNPIVDVNDVAEYQIKESGELRLGFKFPVDIGVLFVKSLNVAEDALFHAGRFLGTVFFGKSKDYYVTPTGDAAFNSVASNEGEVTSLQVTNLTVTGTSKGTEGGDADTLEVQPGSYYLDLDNETGTCANCLSTTEINESTFTGLNSTNIDDIYLFNTGDTGTGTYIFEDDVTLGLTSADTVTVNAQFGSDLIPATNVAYDIGSAGLRWNTGYFDEVIVNTLSAGASDISGTTSSDFAINTDNPDGEDATLTFIRGTETPNAVLRWDETNNRYRFETFPVYLDDDLTVAADARIEGHAGIGTNGIVSATGVVNINETFTDPAGSNGLYSNLEVDLTADNSGSHYGITGYSSTSGSGTAFTLSGTNGLTGVGGYATNGTTDTVANAQGLFAGGSNIGGGTIDNAYGLRVGGFLNPSGTITTQYGLYVSDMTVGSTNYAILTNAGNIVFNSGGDASSDVRIAGDLDANLFFTDASTDQVGIGTAAPDAKLHIVGGDLYIAPDSGYTFDNASGDEDLYVYGNLEVDGTLYTAGQTIAGHLLPAADDTYDLGSPTLRWRDLYLGPSSLNIYNTIGADAEYFTIGYDGTPTITFSSLADGIGTARNFNFTGGNVGIGTADPSQELEVSGDILLSGIGNQLIFADDGYIESSADNTIELQSAGTTDFKIADRIPLKVQYTDTFFFSNANLEKTGTADVSTQYPSYDLILQGSGWNTTTEAAVDLTGTLRLTAGSGETGAIPYRIGIFDDTPTEWAAFDLLNQRLGIGDTSPAATLTVGSGDLFQVAGATGNITTAGDIAVNGGDITSTTTLRIAPTSTLDIDAAIIDLSTQTVDVTLNNAADSLNFDSNTLSIDALNNRVGIGTASPAVLKLTVDGGVRLRDATATRYRSDWSASSAGLNINSYDDTAGAYLPVRIDGFSFAMRSDASDAKSITLSNAGDVGIGTAGPNARLHVNPTVTATADFTSLMSGIIYNGGTAMSNWYGAYIDGPTGTGTITNKYALVTESGAGNVGIGTTTPTSKFQIGTDTVVQQWSGSTPYVLIQGVDNEVATPAFTVKDENLGTMFELTTTGDSTVGRAYFGGNVGIGTTGPGAKLEVSASSATPAFSVSQSGSGYIVEFKDGSDQVFYIEDGGAITIGDTSQTGANWSISHDGTQSNILSLAVYDGKLYAGQGSGTGSGDVLVFNGASWSISHDGAQSNILSLAVYNGKLYAGQGNAAGAGDVLVFDGASWSISHDGAQEQIFSLAVYGGKLYAGQGNSAGDGDVLVFNGASWSISHDGAQEGIASLAVYDGKLYAGQNSGAGDGDVLVFNGASWSISHDGAQEQIFSLAVYGGKLYAGQGISAGDGDVLVFNGASWSISHDGAEDRIPSLAVYNGKLYAGQGIGAGDGDVLVFDGASWSISYDGAQAQIPSLAVYNGKLYAGQGNAGGAGDVLVMTEARSSSYPFKFIVGSGASQKTGNLWFEDEDLYGTSGGPGANIGAFKLSHALITTAGLYDVVEDYPTYDSTLDPGDIVAIDPHSSGYVTKAGAEDRSKVVGVISSDPGIRLSQASTSGYVPVALLGRVPVRVDPNGPAFSAGDPLTISPRAGQAIKAETAGMVIGKALENWQPGGKSMVTVFINLTWYEPSTSEVAVDQEGDAAVVNPDGTTTPIASPIIEAEEGIFQKITATILGTFEKLIAKTAEIASAFIKKLTVESLAVKGESVGQAVIPAGENEISVDYPDLTETSKIFFTLDRAVAVGVEKTPGTGFKFLLASPADLPVTIDYWVVE